MALRRATTAWSSQIRRSPRSLVCVLVADAAQRQRCRYRVEGGLADGDADHRSPLWRRFSAAERPTLAFRSSRQAGRARPACRPSRRVTPARRRSRHAMRSRRSRVRGQETRAVRGPPSLIAGGAQFRERALGDALANGRGSMVDGLAMRRILRIRFLARSRLSDDAHHRRFEHEREMRWLRSHRATAPNERSFRFARRRRRRCIIAATTVPTPATNARAPAMRVCQWSTQSQKPVACHGACVTSTGITLWSS